MVEKLIVLLCMVPSEITLLVRQSITAALGSATVGVLTITPQGNGQASSNYFGAPGVGTAAGDAEGAILPI